MPGLIVSWRLHCVRGIKFGEVRLVVPGLEDPPGFRSLGLGFLLSRCRWRGASRGFGKVAPAALGHVAAQGWLVYALHTMAANFLYLLEEKGVARDVIEKLR